MIYTNEMIKIEKEKKKKRQDIINNVVTGILLILIILCAYFFYQKFIQKENPINLFGYRAFVILTGSMEPELNPGDLVFTRKPSEKDLIVGNVITFREAPGSAVTTTHRITDIVVQDGKTYYQTKGDNNSSDDASLVPAENVIGTMSFKISKAGKIVLGITSSGGFALILIVILLKWSINAKKRDKILIREDCRKKFNFPKYIRKKFNSRSA